MARILQTLQRRAATCAVRVPDAGHSVYFERAAAFNRIVEEFFATP